MKTLRELRNKISFDKNNNNNNNEGSSSSTSGSISINKRSSGNYSNNKQQGESSFNNNNQMDDNNNNNNNISNIQNIDWKSISKIEKIDYGNSNLFLLINFNNNNEEEQKNCNNQILLKSSSTIAHDVYAYVLQGILKYPIPEMRLLDFSNLEYTEMSNALLENSKFDESLNEYIKLELEKSFFLILEYRSNGKRFNELNHKEYFSGSKGNKKFKQLGKIIAFEIFSNNFCSKTTNNWNNSTFFSNILCFDTPDKNGWYFSMINSSNISFLNNSPFTIGYRENINRLKLLLFSIFQNPSNESIQIKLMRDHLLKTQNIKIPSSSILYLQKGIAKGIKSIVNHINFTVLENTKENVKNIVKFDTVNNIWKKSIDSIYCPFLLDVLNEIVIEFANYREKTYFVKV